MHSFLVTQELFRECTPTTRYSYKPRQHRIVKVHLSLGTKQLQERYHLKSAPKLGTRYLKGTEGVSCRGSIGNKDRSNRDIKFEKTEKLLPFWKLTLTECELIFSTHSSERTLDSWVYWVELDKITSCLACLHSSKQRTCFFCYQALTNLIRGYKMCQCQFVSSAYIPG